MVQNGSPDQPKASVVIITYKRPGLALNAAKTVRQYNDDVQIIIVDQQNTADISHDDLERLHIDLYNIDEANISLARNYGIEKSLSEIIIFIDDDVEVTASSINEHISAYTHSIAGTAGRVISDGENIPENTDVETGITNNYGTEFLSQFWSTRKQYVDFPYGCNMSFRKSALLELGLFDPRFDKMFDEVDMGVRVTKSGKKIAFLPNAVAYHHKAKVGGTRFEREAKVTLFYNYYGYYIAKNVPLIFSILAMGRRVVSAFKEKPHATFFFINGFIQYFFTRHHKNANHNRNNSR